MQGYETYREKSVETADRLQLVQFTYEALVRALLAARRAIESGDLEQEAHATSRAMEAVIELASSLDFERGGEIAQHLARLYAYMMQRLTQGLCSSSTDAVDEVLALASTLREAWDALAAQPGSGAPTKKSSATAHMEAAYG